MDNVFINSRINVIEVYLVIIRACSLLIYFFGICCMLYCIVELWVSFEIILGNYVLVYVFMVLRKIRLGVRKKLVIKNYNYCVKKK